MTKQGLIVIGASLAALTFSTAAAAQSPQSVPIRVTFTGTVSSGPSDNIVVRQADGSYAPYTGSTPAYSYQNGAPVSVRFDTTMPTAAFFTANPQYASADGIYRYPVNMNDDGLPFGDISRYVGLDFNGPITSSTPTSTPFITGITMVYDSNSGLYSLEFPNGTWGYNPVDGPSYSYDVATNTLTPTNSACINGCNASAGGISVGGDDTTVRFRGAVVSGSAPQQTSAGFWDMLWSGSWSLPTFGSGGSTSGGATQVPEPSVIVLFGSAAAGLMFARRRKRKAA